MKFIYSFDEAKKLTAEEIGNKSFNFLKLYPQFNVPMGAIVTSGTYDYFVKKNSLPSELEYQLNKNLSNFGEFFSVRSSSTNEDSKKNSFAGQYSTFCGVKRKEISDYIIKVFQSLNSVRSNAYKKENSMGDDKMPVLINEMIPCEKSGVIFTADPVKNDRRRMILEAAYGLGEYVVSGIITPDNYNYNRDSKEVKLKLGSQNKKLIFENGKIKEISVKKEGSCLTKDEINLIISQANDIENLFQSPQDIEWGIFSNMLYIFQARAITGIK